MKIAAIQMVSATTVQDNLEAARGLLAQVAQQGCELAVLPEYFCLMLLAFTTVSAVLGNSTLRGMTALFVGLALGLIGMDQITGQVRYTGGVPELMDGVEIVLVAVGLFAVAEAMHAVLFEGKTVDSENRMSRVKDCVKITPERSLTIASNRASPRAAPSPSNPAPITASRLTCAQ